MIWALSAGIMNALAVFFLKKSSQSFLMLFFSLALFGANFLLFRISLKALVPSVAYALVITTTLAVLKIIEYMAGEISDLALNLMGLALMVLGIFIMR
ncbi:MAG: hypothetical protein ACK40D_05505 [Cyanobacteriota bacterium]|jgi:multidrug transporter EmrE-like cation transporter